VCIKEVPDVDAPFSVQDGDLAFDTDRMSLNAYDASAVEAALRLTEEHGGEIEVVTVGPGDVTETIRKTLAMGADRAVHLTTEDEDAYDARAYAEVLAGYYRDADADALFCGKQSQDTDAGLTGADACGAARLAIRHQRRGYRDRGKEARRGGQGDRGSKITELPSPCLVTCSIDMNAPRIPKLKGIMAAKKKPGDTRSAAGFGSSGAAVTEVVGYEPVPEREPGEKLEGEPEEMARELAGRLGEEVNVL